MPTQEQVRAMVNEHVLVSASQLISQLLNSDSNELACNDELMNIMSKPDYEGAARDEGYAVDERPDGFYLVWEEDGKQVDDGSYLTEFDAWEAACDDNGIEPYQDEAYEHWIVSEWLASKLEDKGELITFDLMGFTIWGRCATGQAIYLDYVMEQICEETPRYMGDDNV